ncbi:hypothetical protein BESB_009520 [Besnoitia besnoiti]|uniref:Transmembrane protein n=1 Tax=Besnoitia besnoiti TaxID=94643 RepID=A0A2A9MQX7_BESBE|nr:hypothetical protein BESB_009520 [Besnoitia besnoiti]PFH38610.1 hypothetical protein BESB_009520 [Besnoitia besnoiti]
MLDCHLLPAVDFRVLVTALAGCVSSPVCTGMFSSVVSFFQLLVKEGDDEGTQQHWRRNNVRATTLIFAIAIGVAIAANIYLLTRGSSRGMTLKRKQLQPDKNSGEPVNLDFDENYQFLFDRHGKRIRSRRRVPVIEENTDAEAGEIERENVSEKVQEKAL